MFGAFNELFVRVAAFLHGQAWFAERMGAWKHEWEGIFGMEPVGAEAALEIIQVVNVHINLTIIYYYKADK